MNKTRSLPFISIGVIGICALLSACSSEVGSNTNLPGQYDRQGVCTNLTRQIEFYQDQGYGVTNQGSTQAQMQQLLATYKANGCDK